MGQLIQNKLQMQMHMCFSYPSIGPTPSMYRSKASNPSITRNAAASSTLISPPVKSKDSKMVLRSALLACSNCSVASPPISTHSTWREVGERALASEENPSSASAVKGKVTFT